MRVPVAGWAVSVVEVVVVVVTVVEVVVVSVVVHAVASRTKQQNATRILGPAWRPFLSPFIDMTPTVMAFGYVRHKSRVRCGTLPTATGARREFSEDAVAPGPRRERRPSGLAEIAPFGGR